jgi:hypothetical protein
VDALQFLLVLALLAAVVWVVSAPLRGASRRGSDPRSAGVGPEGFGEARGSDPSRIPALEAEKEAKYREIRDAELDYRTGKLSEEDWRALDAALRAEAVKILKRLDAASEKS